MRTRPLVAMALAASFFGLCGFSGARADVEGVRSSHDASRTRVVIDLTEETTYELLRLTNPERVVIDLEDGAAFTPPRDDLFVGSVVSRLDIVQLDEALRVVLLLNASNLRVIDFSLAPNREAGRGNRIVVDILADVGETPVAASTDRGEALDVATSSSRTDTAVNSADGAGVDAAMNQIDNKSLQGVPAVATADDSTEQAVLGAGQEAGPGVASEPGVEADSPLGARRSGLIAGRDKLQFSGTWQHEWAWASETSDSQKFESIIQPRWDLNLADGVDLTAILRVRGDAIGDLGPDDRRPPNYSDISSPWFNSARAELSLREFYVDFRLAGSDWRLGKQQVVWGQADGIKVLDVVNPQSFREFILDDFDDSRIPLWTANVTMPVGENAALQFLWIPDTTYHELAEPGTPYAFTTRRLLPQVPITAALEVEKPDDPLGDSDVGFALTGFVGGWDLSLNYLYRYLDTPVLPVRVRGAGLFRLEPEYRRSHLLGGSFSTVFGDMTLRGELAYNSDTFQPLDTLADDAVGDSSEVSSVLGVDWAFNADALLSVQWFNAYLFDHRPEMGRDESEQLLTLLYQQDFINATWRFRAIGIHSVNDRDTQFQLKLSYWLSGYLQLWVGADVFAGQELGLFGQFDDNDRVLMGFELAF